MFAGNVTVLKSAVTPEPLATMPFVQFAMPDQSPADLFVQTDVVNTGAARLTPNCHSFVTLVAALSVKISVAVCDPVLSEDGL